MKDNCHLSEQRKKSVKYTSKINKNHCFDAFPTKSDHQKIIMQCYKIIKCVPTDGSCIKRKKTGTITRMEQTKPYVYV